MSSTTPQYRAESPTHHLDQFGKKLYSSNLDAVAFIVAIAVIVNVKINVNVIFIIIAIIVVVVVVHWSPSHLIVCSPHCPKIALEARLELDAQSIDQLIGPRVNHEQTQK